jgi:hypothetical protein
MHTGYLETERNRMGSKGAIYSSTRQDGGTARRVWSGPLDGLAVFWNTAGFAERQAQTHTFSPTDVTYLSGVFETVEGLGADNVAWE